MTHPVDAGLGRLRRGRPDRDLDDVEAAVFARVAKRSQGDVFGRHVFGAQIAVTAGALLMGFLVADFVGNDPSGVASEMAVLSDAVAPSIRLEGGI